MTGDQSNVKAAVYVRALTPERAERQRKQLERHVSAQGWALVEVYEDIAEQVALEELLEQAERFDKVVIARLERFGHSIPRTLEVLDRLLGAGADVVAVAEPFDTSADEAGLVRRLVGSLGELQSKQESFDVSGWDRLADWEFAPRTLIDVGVARGTPPLYEAFPDAYLVLIEPLREFERELERIVGERPGEYVLSAVGASEGAVTMHVDPNLPSSSILTRVMRYSTDDREVPVTTLDRLWEERSWAPPFGLKIDVEGFEHEVVAGAEKVLAATDFVIAELSVVKRFEEDRSSRELIELMRAHGLEVRDVLDAFRFGGIFADVLFARARD